MYTIYTKEDCNYCDNLKKLLDVQKIEWHDIQIGRDISRDDFLKTFPEVKKVPLVIDGDKLIGGYNDMVEVLRDANSNKN
jgi:glutaredoxin